MNSVASCCALAAAEIDSVGRIAIAARRTAGDLSAKAICISSSALPALAQAQRLERGEADLLRRVGLEHAISGGAAPVLPAAAGGLGQRDLEVGAASARHGGEQALDGGAAAAAPSRAVVEAGCTANGAR